MSGWNFSSLEGRWIEESPPWDFKNIIVREASGSQTLLDLGTGGGEFLSSLSPLPGNTYCTEGYIPNLKVARDRLKPIGVEVVYTFCEDNNVPNQKGALPFKSESLELVIDRHESFIASEVFRILTKSGLFLTQQVGSEHLEELNEALGVKRSDDVWNLDECKRQIENAGFEIVETKDAKVNSWFKDVGAVVCLLRSAPWQIPDFSIDGYRQELVKLHHRIETKGSLRATSSRFYVSARKK